MSAVPPLDRTYAALVLGGWSPTCRQTHQKGEELEPSECAAASNREARLARNNGAIAGALESAKEPAQ